VRSAARSRCEVLYDVRVQVLVGSGMSIGNRRFEEAE